MKIFYPSFQFFEILARLIATIVATILILMTSEFTPKSVFLINPDAILEFLAVPIWVIYTLMFPLVWVTVGLSKWFITKVLRLSYSEEKPAFGLTDLNHYLQNHFLYQPSSNLIKFDMNKFYLQCLIF